MPAAGPRGRGSDAKSRRPPFQKTATRKLVVSGLRLRGRNSMAEWREAVQHGPPRNGVNSQLMEVGAHIAPKYRVGIVHYVYLVVAFRVHRAGYTSVLSWGSAAMQRASRWIFDRR